ncbi:MAG: RluA family pseudouridine synthase [Eubacterium sp.]|nr:RluA family pseudouridine synthase [Eubacterium sp.]
MERTFTYKITAEESGKDIRTFLRSRGYSKHILASMKPIQDAVMVNDIHQYMSYPLSEGDILRTKVRDEESSETIVPAPIPFGIIYEDEDILVIDKPANEAIHPAISHPANTLANGVAWYYKEQGIPYVFRCINRLDRDTTGLLITAKNLLSACVLEQALLARKIHRTYIAIAEGFVPDSGTIDLPIGRREGSLIERCVDRENGDRAVTHYKTLKRFKAGYSLVELHLETGRTHQIRVHMNAIGHPLLGDTLYNPSCIRPYFPERKPWNADLSAAAVDHSADAADHSADAADHSATAADIREAGSRILPPANTDISVSGCPSRDPSTCPASCPGIARQALHSRYLDFIHPITREAVHFEAPIPADMARLLAAEEA